MAKETLYNKYRPQTWDQIVSQESIIKILTNEITNNQLPHVLLFQGPAGCGKTTIARLIGKQIDAETLEIDGAANNGVDNVRNILEFSKQKPILNKYKVIIIDEFHMITEAGQNTLLKIFEDCPEYLIFILATTDPQKILKTIISRCQSFKLTRIPTQQIINRLKYICDQENTQNQGIIYNEDALSYIAKLAKGGMRTAISYLDTCISLDKNVNVENVIKALGISNTDTNADLLYGIYQIIYNENKEKKDKYCQNCIALLQKVYNDGQNLNTFIEQFFEFMVDVSKYKLFNSFLNTELAQTEQLKADLDRYETKKIINILNKLQVFIQTINKQNNNLLYSFEGWIMLQNKEV